MNKVGPLDKKVEKDLSNFFTNAASVIERSKTKSAEKKSTSTETESTKAKELHIIKMAKRNLQGCISAIPKEHKEKLKEVLTNGKIREKINEVSKNSGMNLGDELVNALDIKIEKSSGIDGLY